MKVKDLINLCKKLDQEMIVGIIDHYGKIIEMDKQDFYVSRIGKIPIFTMDTPYIGEEPD